MVRVTELKFEIVIVFAGLEVPTACGRKLAVVCDAGEHARVDNDIADRGVWLKSNESNMSFAVASRE
jgi:hypothetical protein